MRRGLRLLSILTLPCLAAHPLAAADTDPATQNADRILAHRFVTDALDRTHGFPSDAANSADEVALLLHAASRLDPDNPHTLKLLAQALRLSDLPGKNDLRREALRNLIRADPGDLVAQVNYLDLLASASQAIDERATVYRKALDSDALDPQIRSEMAVRLARIAAERGDLDSSRAFLKQALAFNDVNIAALTETARLSTDSPAQQLTAIVALLNANPLQPDAWVNAAGALSAGGAHARAADFLVVALEQTQIAGRQAPAELYLTLGLELAIAGRLPQAHPFLNGIARLPDAPLSSLVAARVLSYEYTPPAIPAATAPAPPPVTAPATAPAAPLSTDDLSARIHKLLLKSVEADPKSADALAQAAWIELSAAADPSPDAAAWITQYAALVPAEDPVLARLQAWQLLRRHQLPEAQAALEKLAPDDSLAKLGLARAQLDLNQRDQAAKSFQELWAAHPTGLLALQISQMARAAHILLPDTPLTRQLTAILTSFPPGIETVHRKPRDSQLVSASFSQRTYYLADPVLLHVHITNTSGHAAPVGPDGLIKTAIGLTAITRGIDPQNLGMFAVEDVQRVYRLDRGATINASLRVDQGPLADRFQSNPIRTSTLNIGLLTAPKINGKEISAGLGGQNIIVGDFDHAGTFDQPGISPNLLQSLTQLVKDLPTMPLDKQMAMANVVLSLLEAVQDKPLVDASPEALATQQAIKDLRGSMLANLRDFLNSPSPTMRAWMVRLLPRTGVGDDIPPALERKSADPDPLVRMMWGTRQSIFAQTDPASMDQAIAALEKQAAADSDPLNRCWFKALLAALRDAKAHPPAQSPAP